MGPFLETAQRNMLIEPDIDPASLIYVEGSELWPETAYVQPSAAVQTH